MLLERPMIIIIVLVNSVLGISQTLDTNIFDETYLHEIRINFSEEAFHEKMLFNHENPDENNRISYLMAEISIDGTHIDSVGIRYKGKSTFGLNRKKNPMKIDFNEFVKGKKYDGLKKLNLNNGFLDPSFIRESLSFKMLREAGIIAPRTSYAKVFINNKYWGLYLILEQLDQTFLKTNYNQDDKFDIVKVITTSNFKIQKDTDRYRKSFKIKSSEDSIAWVGFENFIEVLNRTNKNNFEEEIIKVFNVEQYLRITAMNVIVHNWDTDRTTGRNVVMYAEKGTGYFNWLPWDYNSSYEAMNSIKECELFPDFDVFNMSKRSLRFYNNSFANRDVQFNWDFGDGNYSNLENPIHRYRKNGKYDVCLQISFKDKCNETICKSIDTKVSELDCSSVKEQSIPYTLDFQVYKVLKVIPECCDEWTKNCEILYQNYIRKTQKSHSQAYLTRYNRNLIKRIMEVSRFEDQYLDFVCEYVSGINVEDLSIYIDTQAKLIRMALTEDKNRLHSLELFELEVSNDINETRNLKTRISQRKLEIQKQLVDLNACTN